MMASKKNGKKKSERASVSRERRLALALAEVLDFPEDESKRELARDLLGELGYSNLESVTKRVEAITKKINEAVADGDGEAIARLGTELRRAKLGKPATVAAETTASDE